MHLKNILNHHLVEHLQKSDYEIVIFKKEKIKMSDLQKYINNRKTTRVEFASNFDEG